MAEISQKETMTLAIAIAIGAIMGPFVNQVFFGTVTYFSGGSWQNTLGIILGLLFGIGFAIAFVYVPLRICFWALLRSPKKE